MNRFRSVYLPLLGLLTLIPAWMPADPASRDLWVVTGPVADAAGPRVVRVVPRPRSILGSADFLTIEFNEALAPNSLGGGAFRIYSAGPDEILNTTDDLPISIAGVSYTPGTTVADIDLGAVLPPGWYRAAAGPPVADVEGNPMGAPYSWTFWALALPDRDHDGVPDDQETGLDTNPDNPDSDGDGTFDGEEDPDDDRLTNAGEALMGTDPLDPDSDDDTVLDGDEDRDQDDLSDGEEIRLGTNPFVADSDGDAWPDGVEVLMQSDPLDPASTPRLTVVAAPPASVILPGMGGPGDLPLNVVVSSPPVRVISPGIGDGGGLRANVTVARPPVSAIRPALGGDSGLALGTVVGRPPVRVVNPGFGEGTGGVTPNLTVAHPPVTVHIPPSPP